MIIKNPSRGRLVEYAIRRQGARLTEAGALVVWSGNHTGRSPDGKLIVHDDITQKEVDWVSNNPMTQKEWSNLLEKFSHHEDMGSQLTFHMTGAAGGHPASSINLDIYCDTPSHALFCHNMFQQSVDNPIETVKICVYPSITDTPVVAINFSERTILISGTLYAGEIKKSVFTYLNFLLPAMDILPMHCSINCDTKGENPTVFFGLSGTGKTTLSSDPQRLLLGDDEHGWSDDAIFNFEGGCYAKTLDLKMSSEPQIFIASHKFGSIFENVALDDHGIVNFSDSSLTKNGRSSYPIENIARSTGVSYINKQPKNVIMLTCDAFGVLPAICKLSKEEARDQFLLGYTSKVAGTESGVDDPVATFSPCFGAPFMPRSPDVYADLLVKFLEKTNATCWLINTGWSGGPPGVGERMPLELTRQIVGAVVDGDMEGVPTFYHDHTNFTVPDIGGVPPEYLHPELAWSNPIMYNSQVKKLWSMFEDVL